MNSSIEGNYSKVYYTRFDLLLLIILIDEDSLLNVLGRPSSSWAALSFAET
jgi:hypothetical protein